MASPGLNPALLLCSPALRVTPVSSVWTLFFGSKLRRFQEALGQCSQPRGLGAALETWPPRPAFTPGLPTLTAGFLLPS